MKKLYLILFLTALVPFAAVSQSANLYVWQAGGLEMTLPAGWAAGSTNTSGKTIKLAIKAPGGVSAAIKAAPSSAELETIFQKAAEAAGLDASRELLLEESLNGMPCLQAELFSPEDDDPPLAGYVAVFQNEGRTFVFTASGSEEAFHPVQNDVVKLALSFHPADSAAVVDAPPPSESEMAEEAPDEMDLIEIED